MNVATTMRVTAVELKEGDILLDCFSMVVFKKTYVPLFFLGNVDAIKLDVRWPMGPIASSHVSLSHPYEISRLVEVA